MPQNLAVSNIFYNDIYDDDILLGIRPVIDVPVKYINNFNSFYIEFEPYAASYSENQLNTNYMAVPAGMTWGEWVNSSLNDMKFLSVSGGLILMENSQNVIADLDENKYVLESDVIRKNGHYRIQLVL